GAAVWRRGPRRRGGAPPRGARAPPADAMRDAVPVPDALRPDAVAIDVPIVPDGPVVADAPPPPPPDAPGQPDAPCVVECIDGDTLRSCPDGTPVACPLFCISSGTPHCGVQAPSNGVPANLTDGTSGLTVSSGLTYIVMTDTGAIVTSGGAVIRGGGTGVMGGIGFFQVGNLSVVSAASITVEDAAALRPAGTRPIVFLSAGDVTIRG